MCAQFGPACLTSQQDTMCLNLDNISSLFEIEKPKTVIQHPGAAFGCSTRLFLSE